MDAFLPANTEHHTTNRCKKNLIVRISMQSAATLKFLMLLIRPYVLEAYFTNASENPSGIISQFGIL